MGLSLAEAGTQGRLGNPNNSSEFLQGSTHSSAHFYVPTTKLWGPFWKVSENPTPYKTYPQASSSLTSQQPCHTRCPTPITVLGRTGRSHSDVFALAVYSGRDTPSSTFSFDKIQQWLQATPSTTCTGCIAPFCINLTLKCLCSGSPESRLVEPGLFTAMSEVSTPSTGHTATNGMNTCLPNN